MKLAATFLTIITLSWNSVSADSPGCRRVEGEENGQISSPRYPSNYGPDEVCSWRLTVEEGYFIKLTFQEPFSLEYHDSCNFDYIQLNDVQPGTGNTIKSQKLCGTQRPEQYISSTSSMLVTFKSDGSEQASGFSALWTKYFKPCGSQIEGENGVIEYPHANAVLPDTRQCSWNISARMGAFIRLEFDTAFNLGVQGDNTTCNGDTIQIYDVLGNSSLFSRGSWCGMDRPPVITSFGSQMYIMLQRDDESSNKTISVKWRAVNDCGGVFTTPEGHVMSYNYPTWPSFVTSGFPNCTWDIINPQTYNVIINFHDSMQEIDCRHLQILDYSEHDEKFIPRQDWCVFNMSDQNVTSLSRVTSASSKIRLQYQHGANGGPRFYASWKTACDQTLSALKGNFSSPGYGTEYPPSQDCEWVIEGAKDHMVRLDFQSAFDIESSNDGICSYDYVEVFDSSPSANPVSRGRFCGTQPPVQLISSSEKMVVRFHSDQSKNGKGFSAAWDITCGDVYTTLQGNITSPGFPSHYPDNFDCRWEIQVPDGYAIELTFNEPFSLEENTGCEADYLEVYDFTLNRSLSKRGRWCGQNMPPLQTSLTSRVLLIFHSDDTKNHIGFQAKWDAGKKCGREFRSPNGTFTSPGFPQPYPNDLRCRWEIHAIPGQRVKLDFGSIFDIEMNKDDCRYDGVEVLDSLSNGTVLSYGKWCSVQKIPVFYSMSTLVVLFYSDTGKSGQGFSASWESVSGCDETSSSETGHLLSPNYPSNYPEYEECRWEILPSPEGADNVTLHFEDRFDLESHPNCTYDYVEIYLANQKLGRWCGSVAPPDVISGGQTMLVIFRSDKSVTGAGFFASWN